MTENSSSPEIQRLLSGSNVDPIEIIQEGQLLGPILLRAAKERGHSEELLCSKLKITRGYFRQIQNGRRDGKKLSDDFTRGCADYLNVPWWLVEIFAGKVTLASEAIEFEAKTGTSLVQAFETAKLYAKQSSSTP